MEQVISNIVLSILSFALALIAVVVSICTLKQNGKMIEATTRPYIGITGEYVDNGSKEKEYKLVLKNYGSSEAIIDKIDFIGVSLKEALPVQTDREPFEHLVGSSILPGQSFICVLTGSITEDVPANVSATIEYTSSSAKTYTDTFQIPLGAFYDITPGRVFNRCDPQRIIAFTLQTIADKML